MGLGPGPGQKCVLVVDDDVRSLKLMAIVLGKAGYRVVTVTGGQQGLECLFTEQPDVVVVDLMMPGMDGLEFCRRVRAGADAVLVKPFERQALLAELARLDDRDPLAPSHGDRLPPGE